MVATRPARPRPSGRTGVSCRVLGPVVAGFAAVAGGCDFLLPAAPEDNEVLDAPMDELTGTQLAVHLEGDEQFGRRFSVAEGLGPTFNAPSCDQCHVGEGKGHIVFNLPRFGRMGSDGFDPMFASGGPQLQTRAIPGFEPEQLPEGVTGVSAFMPPSVTGLGLLEAVNDAVLLALADPDDADGDGISGRVQLLDERSVISEIADLEGVTATGPPTRGTQVGGRYIGRFGRKAGTINLLHQTVTAYRQDMGLTTHLSDRDLLSAATGNFAEDNVADPEISSAELNAVVFYLKTLRPPLRRNEEAPEVRAGEAIFSEIGCAACHIPILETGNSEIAALDRMSFHPYTDLLLHDMGPELDDGYTEGRAETSEWRTTPLWGLGLSAEFQGGEPFYLHDGRARTLVEAVEYHGGEAAASREAFGDLSADARASLLAFLESL